MKKKVIILSTALMISLTGIVSAASIWGTYKGNDIIRLTVDGIPVKTGDVPPISYNNRTMIPINLLNQAGINYSWNSSTKTVNIQSKSNGAVSKAVGIDWRTIYNHLKNFNVNAISIGITEQLDGITADYNGTAASMTDAQYNEILKTLAYSDATYMQIYFKDKSSYSFTSKTVRNFYEGLITNSQLDASTTVTLTDGSTTTMAQLRVSPEQGQSNSSNTSSGSSSTNSTVVSKIDGDFNGFNEGNLYQLQNGQIWKQTSYEYKYVYKYCPKVTIYKDGAFWYMAVDGVDKQVKVEQIK